MRRLVWAIDPENDSMNSLAAKIRHDKNLILDDKIEFSLDIPRELNDMVIPGEIRYQLTSIINEALTNTSKYAQASHVWVSFSKSDRKLMLRIRDDGIGFNMDDVKNDKTKATGYGFGNMQKRISRIKGTLSIHSVPDKETTLEATNHVS